MEFNNSFVYSARNVFLSEEGPMSERLVDGLSLENNSVFNRYLITEIDKDEIEIPIIARTHIESIIADLFSLNTQEKKVKTIVLPLYENSFPLERRTFNSFFKQCFTMTNFNSRLQKITSSKGEVYYGGKGLIFDSNYNPLILCTLKVRRVSTPDGTKMEYCKPVIYISPLVFLEPTKLINKGIIKEIIPYYTSRGIIYPSPSRAIFSIPPITIGVNEQKKAKVIVDNLDRFFVKPIAPKPQSCSDESFNKCLIDNIDDIIYYI